MVSPSASRAAARRPSRPPMRRSWRIWPSSSPPASTCRRSWWCGSSMYRASSAKGAHAMAALDELMEMARRVEAHRPNPRAVVDAAGWGLAADALRDGRVTLLGLWGDRAAVHMALLDEAAGDFGVLSLDCAAGRFPSIGAVHPPAIRLERAIRDLFGFEPEGAPDMRPWLDHGRWDLVHPLGRSPPPRHGAAAPYVFLPAEGESLHQIPVGPVHAGIIEPGHFRFTAGGETVVRLEERLGYVHKGIEKLMEGADLDRAAKLAGRTSGDSTVAYAIAFARAAEAALGVEVPPRGQWLRALMAELERLANHFGDIGAICNDASFALMHAHCAVLRERVFRPELARRFGAGGYVGRASGRAFDARRNPGYAPYDRLKFDVPVRDEGDVDARVWIRIREVEQSLDLIGQILERLPTGASRVPLPSIGQSAEGVALVEGFRGDVLVWLRLGGDGKVERCHLRDPSWFQWPLLEAAVDGNIVADFPLCNKSFNCSYSGHDL